MKQTSPNPRGGGHGLRGSEGEGDDVGGGGVEGGV